MLTFFYFLLSSILLIISCVIRGFIALFSTFLTRSLTVSNTHSFILFHCTSTFPLSHPVAPRFSSGVSYTLRCSAYNFSKSLCGRLFCTLIIFFNLVQILATSKLWSVNICPRQCLHILHNVSESMFHKYLVQLMSTPISWCLPCIQSSLRLPESCVGDNQSIYLTKVNKHLSS